MHQEMSSPETVDAMMVLPLRIAAFGMLFISLGLCWSRGRLALARLRREDGAPDLPPEPAPLDLDTGGDHA